MGRIIIHLISTDGGLNWSYIDNNFWTTGIAFADSLTGIITGATDSSSYYSPDIITSDGGKTWNKTKNYTDSWQPLGIKNSKTFFEVRNFVHINTYNNRPQDVYRSDNGGQSWKLAGTVNPNPNVLNYLTGTIAGDLNKLYVQEGVQVGDGVPPGDPVGIFVSEDQGATWNSICGPGGMLPSRFYVKDNYIYAADVYGGLYLNSTGKANGPRLQIEKDNLTRHTSAASESIIPFDIYYSKDAYYEPVDSLIFTLSFNDGMIFNHDSVATGWKEIRRIATDTNVTFILRRTDPTPPQIDSFILRAYCQATISKEQTGVVALDEINFNQDTTFRDCMIASLTKTDSLYVDITDNICGDSILQKFLATNQIPLKIISIYPNPSSANITVDYSSAYLQPATIQILDELGNVLKEQQGTLTPGINSQSFTLDPALSGTFFIRITTGKNTVTGKFVKD